VLTGGEFDGSLPRLVNFARVAASVIRERFSPDAWRAIDDLVALIELSLAPGPVERAMVERVEAALRIISSFSGLAQENMTQLAGWRFLELGRRIERALQTCRFARCFADGTAPSGGLDVLLELADSQLTYRQRYVMIAAKAPVIDLVMLDPNNPRSVAYQVDRIETHLAALPKGQTPAGRLTPVQQIAASIATRFRIADAGNMTDAQIVDIEDDLMALSEAIASTYLTHIERSQSAWDAQS
ncbi:MAG: alpha-E domain-containing protein, partial [Hyphomicrobiales bacterium]|nr:alpha-E domain-containing protein [Hyphomicrobiales bacterium]